jgi:tRNA A37 threonylcarbamoyladenosine synthetase subunit TsaC/SUA5/YrdC
MPLLAKKVNGKSQASKLAEIISIEDSASELWKLDKFVDILNMGGVGVIPTDSCYSFITTIASTKGIERIASLKSKKSLNF